MPYAILAGAMLLQTYTWVAPAMVHIGAWLVMVDVHDGTTAVHGIVYFL